MAAVRDWDFDRAWLALAVLVVLAGWGLSGSGAAVAVDGLPAKIHTAGIAPNLATQLDGPLTDLYRETEQLRAADASITSRSLATGSKSLADALAAQALRVNEAGAVQVDVLLAGDGPDAATLAALGVTVEHYRPDLGRAQYQVPVTTLAAVARLDGVQFLQSPTYAVAQTGSVLSQGDAALRADEARAMHNVGGRDVRVGVISDGILGLSQARASGDVPVLVDARAFSSEGLNAGAEGTAMLEIVHDLAPEADLSFANAATDLDMIEAVNYLAQRNDVVVDDLTFFFPGDQQSAISKNTAAALNNPAWPIRSYVASAGNWAQRHYAGRFEPGPDGKTVGLDSTGAAHRFRATSMTTDAQGLGPQSFNEIRLIDGESVSVILFWDDPWGASTNDYDLYLLNNANVVVAESVAGQGTAAVNPRERLVFTNNTGLSTTFRIVIHNFENDAQPRNMELFVFDAFPPSSRNSVMNFNTLMSSLLAQSDSGGGVITVGAIDQQDIGLDTIELFSSRGPTNNGVTKPDLTAIDGVLVTGAGGFSTRFFGTSAAAPHTAAVAALMLEGRPSLLAADGGNPTSERALLRSLMLGATADLGVPGTDNIYGAGRLDAVLALQQSLSPTVQVTTNADAGPGSFRAAMQALNDVASGSGIVGGEIEFDQARTITLTSPLPALTADGVRIEGGRSVVVGSGVVAGSDGLVIRGDNSTVHNLTLRGFPAAGLHLNGGRGATLQGVRVLANGTGLRIDGGASEVVVSADGAGWGMVATSNTGSGVVVDGSSTRDVQIRDSFIGSDEMGTEAGNGSDGITISGGASAVVVGARAAETPVTAGEIAVSQIGPLAHTFRGTVMLGGVPAQPGTVVDAFVDGLPAGATTIGSVEVDGRPGFVLTIFGPGETVTFAVDGEPAAESFSFEAGASTTVTLMVGGAVAAAQGTLPGGNTIAFNSGAGVRVSGSSARGNTFRGNEIYRNGALSIDLVAANDPVSGVTPNDAGDVDQGPNTQLNHPVITSVTFTAGLAMVEGTTHPNTMVDLYAATDAASHPGVPANARGAGGAVRLLGSVFSDGPTFRLVNVRIDGATTLTALAVDDEGNTSEFGPNQVLPSGPVVTAVSPSRGSTAGGTLVTLTGPSFDVRAGFRVAFGSEIAPLMTALGGTVRTTVEVLTPQHAVGAVSVEALNPDGRVFVLDAGYTYVNANVVVLQPGWNNVVWQGGAMPVTAAINTIAGRADRVFAWNAQRQAYELFAPGAPSFLNTLTRLQPGRAVWVFVVGSGTLTWEQPLP